MFSLKDICMWTGGEFIPGKMNNAIAAGKAIDESFEISEICRDSRKAIPAAALFVAFKGGNYDGHDFLEEAEKNGARVFLVERVLPNISAHQIKVPDTIKAIQDIATAYRKTLKIPVLAITGSNGKTTTKNFCTAILAKKYKVAGTKGNLNNHIGLPISVLSIKRDDEIAVFEIGMNKPGEIRTLANVCLPTSGIITNIGTAHIEFLGSKAGIAEEKASLAKCLPENGFLIIPKKDEYAETLAAATKAKLITVADDDEAFALIVEQLQVGGLKAKHILMSALFAAAAGREYGVDDKDIVDAILASSNDRGRFAVRQISVNGVLQDIIDDTYNANPDSVCASVNATAELYPDRKKVLVLGKLAEQGHFIEEGYKRILKETERCSFDKVIFVDIPQNYPGVVYVKDQIECAKMLTGVIADNASSVQENGISDSIILFKGSRSSNIEKVIELLENSLK